MPGFCCAHHHLYSTLARGAPLPGFNPASFMDILEGLWWKLDRALLPGDLYLSAVPALLSGVRQGMTSLIDHHESQGYQEGVLDEIAAGCRDVGVRAILSLGASDRDGKGAAGVTENSRFLRELDDSGLVSGMMGLHASFTVDDETLAACVEAASEFGVGVHTHLAEDPVDQEETRRRFGLSATERLHRAGALGLKSLVAHGLHLSDSELEILAATSTSVVINPESNLNNAVGCPNLLNLLDHGIQVALGTDGMSSDIRGQLWTTFLLQRHLRQDPSSGMGETWNLLESNSRLFHRLSRVHIGTLAPDAAADIIILDYDPPTDFDTSNLVGHFFFGMLRAPVHLTMINGRVICHDGNILTVDESEILGRSRQAARKLWSRMNTTTRD